jgi:hypothetical protein
MLQGVPLEEWILMSLLQLRLMRKLS